jgi:hypothetical protein
MRSAAAGCRAASGCRRRGQLARELGVSRGLVQECYNQLLAEGYLTSQVGSATRVAAAARPARAGPSAEPAPPPRLIADFRAGVPDLASFPRGDWVWATREACRSVATPDLDYDDPRGSALLRQALAAYLRRCAPPPPTMTASSSAPDSRRDSTWCSGRSPSWASGVPRWKTPATGTWRPAKARRPPGRRASTWCACPLTSSA